ncbi:hypothetical protein HQ544_01975 [Candidatus Falkowbacteria bacterium]|nr:hypothetical protein [Candidatus Falkowbacteria bacterium]
MGTYANIKKNRMKRFLKWLDTREFVSVEKAGKHQYNVKYNYWKRPFPIPFKNNEVNKYIVKALMKKLTGSEICTEEEFDERIK